MRGKTTDLIMSCSLLVTEAYSGQGKDKFWTSVQVGHTIEIMYPLVRQGSNSRGYRAAGLELKNHITGQTAMFTNNNLLQYLSKIKYTAQQNFVG